MKIAIVGLFSKDHSLANGITTHIGSLAVNLAKIENNEIYIVTLGDKDEIVYCKDYTLYILKRLMFNMDTPLDVFTLKRKIIEINPDVVHAHGTWYPYSTLIALINKKYPVVLTVHGTIKLEVKYWENKNYKSYLASILGIINEYIVLYKAKNIIIVSPALENYVHFKKNKNIIYPVSQNKLSYLDKYNVKTIKVIPNGFRTDLFFPMNKIESCKKLNLPLDKKIILTVGNLADIKGQIYLIDAIGQMVNKRKDILCIIVGEGKLRIKLENHIKKSGLDNYIKLVGKKQHKDIVLWMNACDLFVLPSLKESFGIVQIEAMACKKPVVATCNGGSNEIIIDDTYGLLVKPANSTELAEKIFLALKRDWDVDLIGEYSERFSWDQIVKEIQSFYDITIKDRS